MGGGGGGGGRKGGEWVSDHKKIIICMRLLFVLMLYIKVQTPSSSGFSSFNTNTRSNGQVSGITLPIFYRIQSSDLNIDPKFSEFQDPCSSNSLDIVLTRFPYCYNSKV